MNIGILFIILAVFVTGCAGLKTTNYEYLVVVGEKISVDQISGSEKEMRFDSEFVAKYKVLEVYKGAYSGSEIEFRAFDHYGTPGFAGYHNALLYLLKFEGEYYHAKYMFSPLFKTTEGKWAGPYDKYDYEHPNNARTKVRPVRLAFDQPVEVVVPDFRKELIGEHYPEPYFELDGERAYIVYGNYLDDLFKLKKNGVLKARGEFQ